MGNEKRHDHTGRAVLKIVSTLSRNERRIFEKRGFGVLFTLRHSAGHRLLHLIEGADFQLAYAFARNAVLLAQFFQGDGVVLETAFPEDMAFTIVQLGDGAVQQLIVHQTFLTGGGDIFRRCAFVFQLVLEFDGGAFVLANRRVEAQVLGRQAAVHIDDFVGVHVQLIGQQLGLIRVQFTAVLDAKSLLVAAKAEEQFFCAATVPILTMDQERNTYSVIAALIHHMA